MAVSPDGTELYVANESGFLEIWNLTTGERSASIPLSGAVEAPTPGGFGLALSPDAEQIYVAAGYNGLVVVDRQTRAVVNRIRTGGDPRRVAFTTAVSPAVVTNSGGWVDFIR
jgi:YVTN family beta-propeller protein